MMIDSIERVIKYSQDLLILYVEDNENTRESTLLMLEDMFGDIVVAVDGIDGLEKFKNNNIDLVITDINMPRMSGIEMSRKIKELDENMPIFIFSAHNEARLFLDAISIGVEGYLLKPFDIDQFSKSLLKTLENINLRKENQEYRASLEHKVDDQVGELKEKDKLLMQQAKMASVGDMIDAIAHQWKQPLNAFSMYADLLKGDFDDGIVDHKYIKELVADMHFQIEHMTSTLSEFRNFFRPNTTSDLISLKSIFDTISLLLKDELLKNNTQLKYRCLEEIKLFVNENDIKHLFMNLIVNAKDEMVKQDIATKDRVVYIECIEEDSIVSIYVKDNGKGIPEKNLDKIFKPHFTTKSENGGTGIGLYICKQIVDKYNGSITVSNDNGAVFNITLPKK